MAIWYAKGPYQEESAIAGSAFTKGDILVYNSNSSLSQASLLFIGGGRIAGVAKHNSADSLAGDQLCVYVVPLPGTIFWSDCTTGSQMTPGERLDFEISSGQFRVSTSANTPRAIIWAGAGTESVLGQSNASRVMITLLSLTSELAHA